MRTIYAEYNINHDSIDVYTSAGYMLRIDCWEAEKNLKTTYGSECALTSLAVDEPLEYARLYLCLLYTSEIERRHFNVFMKYGNRKGLNSAMLTYVSL